MGVNPPAPPTERLFFALRPDAAATRRIVALQQQLRAAHALRGRTIAAPRLHVTLHLLGDFPAWPTALVDTASAAAARLEFRAFELAFDRVACFVRPRDVPVVLRGGGALDAVHEFRQCLLTELAAADLLPDTAQRFVPHLTLFYAHGARLDAPVDPIAWTVHEFELVHSAIGRGKHTTLARWPLGR